MSYLLPAWELSIEQKKNFRVSCVEAAVRVAMEYKISRDRYEFRVRDILAEDVGLSCWQSNGQAEQQSWVHHRVTDSQIIGVYKIVQNSFQPRVTEIQFARNGHVCAHHPLETCYSGLASMARLIEVCRSEEARRLSDLDRNIITTTDWGQRVEGYFTEPYVFYPGEEMSISLKRTPGDTCDDLILVGIVVERDGARV